MYYSLLQGKEDPENNNQKTIYIGRHDGEPTPQIILNGVGIKKNHAQVVLCKDSGLFVLQVKNKECWEQTLVNGQRLPQVGDVFQVVLNHLDRLFVGVNTLFLVKYPLLSWYLKEQQGTIAALESKQNQLMTYAQDLICHQYSDEQIENDGKIIEFETAFEEAHQLEVLKKKE